MFVRKDLSGLTFGCYTVLDERVSKYVPNGTRIYWKCRCRCGNERYIEEYSLTVQKNRFCPQCKPPAIRNEKLYHIYYGIIARCENPNNPGYYLYGAKGVKMCKEWRESYKTFREWSYENNYKPNCKLSIDRIDSNGNYEPSNCQWISISDNSAKANAGRVKNHSKLTDMYAISPTGEKVEITNIRAFQRQHNEITLPSLHAILNGRMPAKHKGWIFHSNKTRQVEV